MRSNYHVLLLLVSLLTAQANAQTFNFEDALATLGHEGNPATFYENQGLRFSGSYNGVIEGSSNGDAGNYQLEGTNGPASLAADSVGILGQTISLNFACAQTALNFDLGAAYFNISQTPIPLDIQITSYLNGVQQSDQTITVEDVLNDGNGTWYPQVFTNVDRVSLVSVAGGGTWAVDNIIVGHAQPCVFSKEHNFWVIPTSTGGVVVFSL